MIVAVSNKPSSAGLLTAEAIRMTTLTARFGGLLATTRVSVIPSE